MFTCLVCDKILHKPRWTDTHGIAICAECGFPYRLLHYEGDGDARKRVDKGPEPALTDAGVAIAKAYWAECHRMVYPGSFDIGGSGYSGATLEDMHAFNDWYKTKAEAVKTGKAAP